MMRAPSSFEHPAILDAAALARIDDQRSGFQRDAGEPAGHQPHFAADQALGAEIDMAADQFGMLW
ncbi:MAG: hypothetical protein K2X31_04835, partial [Sphingopyxis sp.]|nr:hypothetical protein [Sphingopyxis sp.]